MKLNSLRDKLKQAGLVSQEDAAKAERAAEVRQRVLEERAEQEHKEESQIRRTLGRRAQRNEDLMENMRRQAKENPLKPHLVKGARKLSTSSIAVDRSKTTAPEPEPTLERNVQTSHTNIVQSEVHKLTGKIDELWKKGGKSKGFVIHLIMAFMNPFAMRGSVFSWENLPSIPSDKNRRCALSNVYLVTVDECLNKSKASHRQLIKMLKSEGNHSFLELLQEMDNSLVAWTKSKDLAIYSDESKRFLSPVSLMALRNWYLINVTENVWLIHKLNDAIEEKRKTAHAYQMAEAEAEGGAAQDEAMKKLTAIFDRLKRNDVNLALEEQRELSLEK